MWYWKKVDPAFRTEDLKKQSNNLGMDNWKDKM